MSLTEPNFYDSKDRRLYDELLGRRRNGHKLTELEIRFMNTIYHQEEYYAGLDGRD